MKLAKASQEEIDGLMQWLQARENTDDPPPPFRRIVFGYETLLANCADPSADVLEFKPELKAAMEDKKRLDRRAIRLIHRDEVGEDRPCVHHDIDLRAAIDAAQT